VKNGTVIEIENWDVPIVWNSNYLPNYSEDFGEITIRYQWLTQDMYTGRKSYASFVRINTEKGVAESISESRVQLLRS
jgi:hypothetical protein